MKSALIFIYNTDDNILKEYKSQFSNFFERNGLQVIIQCSHEKLVELAKDVFPTAKINYSGKSSGSNEVAFFNFLQQYFLMASVDNFDFFYRIETRSICPEVSVLLSNWQLIENNSIWPKSNPVIYGYHQALRENNKLFHREDILNLFTSNNLKTTDFIFHFVDKYIAEGNKLEDLKKKVLINPDFYSFFEFDLRQHNMNAVASTGHWENHGIKEGHRIPNPVLVESFGKTSFYVSGNNFVFNQAYMKRLELVNWSYEIANPRRNGWDQFFGLYAYVNDGVVFGLDNGQIIDLNLINDSFDLSMYRDLNPDLSNFKTEDSLKSHFISNGCREGRFYSINSVKTCKFIVNNKDMDAKLAFFVTYPLQNSLVTNLKTLLTEKIKFDLYIDSNSNSTYCKGFCASSLTTDLIKKELLDKEFLGLLSFCNISIGLLPFKKYKCAFVQEGINNVSNADKVINLKVLKFLNDQTLIDFVADYNK